MSIIGEYYSPVLAADGRLLIAITKNNHIKVFDLKKGEVIAGFRSDVGLSCLKTTPDGKTILAGDNEGQVHFFTLEGFG